MRNLFKKNKSINNTFFHHNRNDFVVEIDGAEKQKQNQMYLQSFHNI